VLGLEAYYPIHILDMESLIKQFSGPCSRIPKLGSWSGTQELHVLTGPQIMQIILWKPWPLGLFTLQIYWTTQVPTAGQWGQGLGRQLPRWC
jgi:hypothetical protein